MCAAEEKILLDTGAVESWGKASLRSWRSHGALEDEEGLGMLKARGGGVQGRGKIGCRVCRGRGA